MRLIVVAIGQRMPGWVKSGWSEYSRRFPRGTVVELKEISAIRRQHGVDVESIRRRESESLLAARPASCLTIALDESGNQWSTAELSGNLTKWRQDGRDVAFLIGGPDGLSSQCLDQANMHWSLSRLTLPHPLVRVVLVEQLYRAWSIIQNHPYHRA